MHKCQGQVKVKGMNFHRTRPCKRNATVERNGGHYCKLHDPLQKQDKEAEKAKEFRTKQEEQAAKFARMQACVKACKEISTEALQEDVIFKMRMFISHLADDAEEFGGIEGIKKHADSIRNIFVDNPQKRGDV